MLLDMVGQLQMIYSGQVSKKMWSLSKSGLHKLVENKRKRLTTFFTAHFFNWANNVLFWAFLKGWSEMCLAFKATDNSKVADGLEIGCSDHHQTHTINIYV